MSRWYDRAPVFDYLVECYAGLEELPNAGFKQRRMFLWQADGEVRLGNIEAFAQHVLELFRLEVTERCVVVGLNQLLIDAGERVRQDPPHGPRQQFGVSHRPEPEYTVVKKVDQ